MTETVPTHMPPPRQTSIGYGDISASLYNWRELLICTLLMGLGSFLWAQVIAIFVTLLSNQSEELNTFRATMDGLNTFMHRQQLPQTMRFRLREYFHQTHHLRRAVREQGLLGTMSPALQSEVAWICNGQWVKRVPFFKDVPTRFLIVLTRSLTALVFAPGETTPLGNMYIVCRGLALYGGRLLGTGKVWGTDVILRAVSLRLSYAARAMNYLEVFTIDREELETVAALFPTVARTVRAHAVRMAARRGFILEASRRVIAAAAASGPPQGRQLQFWRSRAVPPPHRAAA